MSKRRTSKTYEAERTHGGQGTYNTTPEVEWMYVRMAIRKSIDLSQGCEGLSRHGLDDMYRTHTHRIRCFFKRTRVIADNLLRTELAL